MLCIFKNPCISFSLLPCSVPSIVNPCFLVMSNNVFDTAKTLQRNLSKLICMNSNSRNNKKKNKILQKMHALEERETLTSVGGYVGGLRMSGQSLTISGHFGSIFYKFDTAFFLVLSLQAQICQDFYIFSVVFQNNQFKKKKKERT